MTITQAEDIINEIKTSQKWQDEFVRKMETMDSVSGYDKMNFDKMCKIIARYRNELFYKCEDIKKTIENALIENANLFRADLFRANLSRADLSEANLSEANLSEAYLYVAYLFRANLYRANLSEADLSEANLFKANLSKADLFKANLCGTIGNNKELISIQTGAYLVCMSKHAIQIGCKNYTREEWNRFSNNDILEMDGQKALDFWRNWKEIILKAHDLNFGGKK
jgi:hypothetical protein